MNFLKKAGFVIFPMILTACQSVLDAPTTIETPTVQIAHDDPQWQNHLTALKNIQQYAVKGQFGYISPQERFSSHFDWQYSNPSRYGLILSSNLSSKSLKLQRTARGLTISDNEGNSRTESDIHKLMEEIIGVSFPIDQFAYWVKGQPEQGSQYIVNAQRLLAEFRYPLKDAVWKATFIEYHQHQTPALPKLIVLENGAQTLKIRIDEWKY